MLCEPRPPGVGFGEFRAQFGFGGVPRRRCARIRRRHTIRLVAAERTKRVADGLIEARADFAGDLVEARARVAEQLLLRHGRIGSGGIGRRLRFEPRPCFCLVPLGAASGVSRTVALKGSLWSERDFSALGEPESLPSASVSGDGAP